MVRWDQAARAVLLVATGMLCAGCDQSGAEVRAAAATGEAQARALPAGEALFGGDTRAWPTAAGDAADSGYCRAALRLPLEREPAWVCEYGSEFSDAHPNSIVHHDGLLVVTARCPQLLGIDVVSGQRLFNVDVYEHLDRDLPESFGSLFFHPRGLLVGMDDLGRHYCWDLAGGTPERRWLGPPSRTDSGFVVGEEAVIAGWQGSTRSLAIRDGSVRWSYPDLLGGKGVVLGADGTVVSWLSGSEFFAVGAATGELRWSDFSGVAGYRWASRAVIDDARGLVYFVLPDERVQCRLLATGELEWEHRWTDLMSQAARDALYADSPVGQVPLHATAAMVTPDGLVLTLVYGAALALDQQGNRRWVHETDFPVLGGIGFANAVLISERYLAPEFVGLISWLRVYCPAAIDWEQYRVADEQRQRTGMFERRVALDPASGEPLDYFEPDYPARVLLPARDKIIIGEMTPVDGPARRILAYDWIAVEGT